MDGGNKAITYKDAVAFLYGILDDVVRKEYPSVRDAWLDGASDGSGVMELAGGGYDVRIGAMGLGEIGCEVSPPDLAWATKSAMHERRHLWQKEFLYRQPLSGKDLDMARMEACSMAYQGYNDETYHYRLSEIDADLHGMKDAVEALEGAFPGTDWEEAMLAAQNSRDDVCDGLRSSSPSGLVMSRAYVPGHRYGSLDEVYGRLEELSEQYLREEHADPCREFSEKDDATVEKNSWDGKFVDLLLGDGKKRGTERDREILGSILQARVFDVGRYFPGMAGEIESVKEEYGVQTDAVRKVFRIAAEQDGHGGHGGNGGSAPPPPRGYA